MRITLGLSLFNFALCCGAVTPAFGNTKPPMTTVVLGIGPDHSWPLQTELPSGLTERLKGRLERKGYQVILTADAPTYHANDYLNRLAQANRSGVLIFRSGLNYFEEGSSKGRRWCRVSLEWRSLSSEGSYRTTRDSRFSFWRSDRALCHSAMNDALSDLFQRLK